MGHPPPLKNDPPLLTEKQTTPLKSEAPSKKWFLEKNTKKLESVINTCVSIIKQHWKKMAKIPEESDSLAWSMQNVARKVKQFASRYYITSTVVFLKIFLKIFLKNITGKRW